MGLLLLFGFRVLPSGLVDFKVCVMVCGVVLLCFSLAICFFVSFGVPFQGLGLGLCYSVDRLGRATRFWVQCLAILIVFSVLGCVISCSISGLPICSIHACRLG